MLLLGCLYVETTGRAPSIGTPGTTYECALGDEESVDVCIPPFELEGMTDDMHTDCGCNVMCLRTRRTCFTGSV